MPQHLEEALAPPRFLRQQHDVGESFRLLAKIHKAPLVDAGCAAGLIAAAGVDVATQ